MIMTYSVILRTKLSKNVAGLIFRGVDRAGTPPLAIFISGTIIVLLALVGTTANRLGLVIFGEFLF